MANVAWPSSICAKTFSLMLIADKRSMTAPFGGSDQVVDMFFDFWRSDLTIDLKQGRSAGQVEALVNWLAGGINTVSFGHMAKSNIYGSLVGPAQVEFAVSQGASSFVIETTPDTTLMAGDMLGIGGQLVQVATDCIAPVSGLMIVQLANSFREDIPAGSAITLVNPTAKFRLISTPPIDYSAGVMNQVSLSFEESIDG